jgi:hypothetical protein
MTDTITTEDARGLAARWAVWQTDAVKLVDELTDDERESLFAWVRAFIDEQAAEFPARGNDEHAHVLAFELRIEGEDAFALGEAAGCWS